MCYVTATQLKNNLSYYLQKSMTEDVYITKNNVVISILTNPQMKALAEVKEMLKTIEIDKSITLSDDEIIFEEIMKK